MFGYFGIDGVIEKYFCVDSTNPSKDFTATTNDQKNYYMRHFEVSSDLVGGSRIIYARAARRWIILQPIWNKQTRFYESVNNHILVPEFYYDRSSCGYLKHLKYVGKVKSVTSEFEMVLYI